VTVKSKLIIADIKSMRLRFKTSKPHTVWYKEFSGPLPKNKPEAVNALVQMCYDYFGVQFTRYDEIVVTLIRGSHPIVDIVVKPTVWLNSDLKKSA